jgi:hypothetical protein
MARIVVLGGQGYLGGRAVAALRAAGADVHVASRSSARVVDVARPETYGALADADVVVDLVDTVAHPPDGLLAWCVAQGKVVLEATSDSRTVERLAAASWPGPGALVLGCGIFTGLSNLLARDAVEACPGGAARLTLGIASSPLSGAGQGTIAMMVDALDAPVVRYAAGVRHVRDTVEVGPRVDFGVNGRPELRATLRIALAEAMMIHTSTAVPTVDVYFAPSPALLVPAFAVIPGWLARRRWFQAFMRGLLHGAAARAAAEPGLAGDAGGGGRGAGGRGAAGAEHRGWDARRRLRHRGAGHGGGGARAAAARAGVHRPDVWARGDRGCAARDPGGAGGGSVGAGVRSALDGALRYSASSWPADSRLEDIEPPNRPPATSLSVRSLAMTWPSGEASSHAMTTMALPAPVPKPAVR